MNREQYEYIAEYFREKDPNISQEELNRKVMKVIEKGVLEE